MRPTPIVLFLSLLSKTLAGPLDFWTCTLVLTNASVSDAIFANGRFIVGVGGGQSGRPSTMISEDGLTWRETREETLGSFCTGNGVIVARGNDSIVSSPDGVSWIARRPFRLSRLYSLTFGPGRFFAQVGNEAGTNTDFWSSMDGVKWTRATTNFWPESFTQAGLLPVIEYVFDRWITKGSVLGQLTVPLQSLDGLNFTSNPDWPLVNKFQHNGTAWVGVIATNTSLVATSRDGVNWTTLSPNPNWTDNSNGNGTIYGITTSGGRFFASGSVNYFFESTDGIHWTDHQVDVGRSTKWHDWLGLYAPVIAGNNRAVAFARVSTPPTNNFNGAGKLSVARFYVSQPLTNSIVPELGMASLPALRLEAGTVGSGYHVEATEAVEGAWRRVATVFPTNFPFTFLAPEGEQRGRLYRAVVRD